jgi:hypothetical protein
MTRGKPFLSRTAAPVAAGIGALAMTVAYLIIIVSEDEGFESRAVYFALHLASAGVAAIAGRFSRRPVLRVALLTWAVVSMLVLGILGIFSIGLPLVAFALLLAPSVKAWRDEAPGARASIAIGAAMIAPVAVAVVGLSATG